MDDKSLAESLSEAWDAAEAGEELSVEMSADEEINTGSESEADPDGMGDIDLEAQSESSEADDPAVSKPTDKKKVAAEKEPAGDKDEPPAGLPVDAREAWADTPDSVKAAIRKREDDYSNGIKMYAQAAKNGETMQRVMGPYQQFFAMNGGNPPKVVNDVLATAAVLQMGAPQQRAQAAANLIQQFGVDIGMLDDLLSGGQPAANPNAGYEQMLEQRLAPIQQQLSQYQQREQAAQQQEVQQIHSDLHAFATAPENEFYNDVKADMADILDMAANRGVNMSLKDAYERACRMNDSVAKVIAARNGRPSQQRRRAAASSVSGAPSGGPGAPDPTNLRGLIENAWEEAGQI